MADKKLRIAMLGHKHMLSREGGVEIVVNELATRMVERGHEVIAYDRSGGHVAGGQIEDLREYKGVKIVGRVHSNGGLLKAMVYMSALRWEIRQRKP